jgi:hypothetical protein
MAENSKLLMPSEKSEESITSRSGVTWQSKYIRLHSVKKW